MSDESSPDSSNSNKNSSEQSDSDEEQKDPAARAGKVKAGHLQQKAKAKQGMKPSDHMASRDVNYPKNKMAQKDAGLAVGKNNSAINKHI